MSIRLIDVLQAGFKDGSGVDLDSGTVTVYDAGTTNLRTVYQEYALSTPHLNPLTLDAEGKATAYTNQRVKLLVKSAAGATIMTLDNVGTGAADLTTATASDLSGSGLVANGSAIDVNPDGTTIEISADAIRVKNGGISKAKLDSTTTSVPDEISNAVITASVATNALTIALKTLAGTDASATDPVTIAFRNVTAASGTYVRRQVTGALSVVVPSGGTLGLGNSSTYYLHAYCIDNAGTVELAVSVARVDDGTVVTTTTVGSGSDSNNVLYSTTGRTSVPVRLLGRIKIATGASQASGTTWANSPTEISPVPFRVDLALAQFSASADQTGLVSAADTKVAFNTIVFDNMNVCDTTNNRITCPVAGKYRISGYVGVYATVGQTLDRFVVNFKKNGTLFNFFDGGGATRFGGTGFSTIVNAAAGDYFEIFAAGTTSSSTWSISAQTPSTSYFNIQQITY